MPHANVSKEKEQDAQSPSRSSERSRENDQVKDQGKVAATGMMPPTANAGKGESRGLGLLAARPRSHPSK